MLFVNYKISAEKEELLRILSDNNLVECEEKFDTKPGKPKMSVIEKCGSIKIKCMFTDRPTKDNAFLMGTYFKGKLGEKKGATTLRGVILTEPIYHIILVLCFAFFIFQCIRLGGFSPVPIILLVFDYFMFKDEFKKQRLIKSYIFRAFKITYRNKQEKIPGR